MITVSIDMREFERKARQMGVFTRDQLPYAIAETLNSAVIGPGGAREAVVNKAFPAAFRVRRPNFPRVSTVVGREGKASKTNWRVEMAGDKLKRGSLPQHAVGGVKRPKSGHLAIPGPTIEPTRGPRGIPKRLRPRSITRRLPRRALRVIEGRGIFEGKGGRLVRLYGFASSASIGKRYAFAETFSRVALARVAVEFPRKLQHAVNTAFR